MNNPSKILAIDTVTEGCSAALWIEGEIVEQFEETPRGHTQRILPMVDQLLSEAGCSLKELDAIAYDRG
ncbi:MAG: tRNA (adenosine(37)-N6)-threonylcarbamoyltransferase complex dimerization subunit type 1 TsaB, partial [Gammaproteobacteria bacterium]|nr:tRNA (adenosine(37)-N6)-threonylcarbamoyltransferase complex dimerization subunit type 1 TsaB [Gammaproteobacteria bacterium]